MAVEFALAVVLWAACFGAVVSLARLPVIKFRAQNAARLGAFLQGTGRVDEAVARTAVADYLSAVGMAGSLETGRFLETSAAAFYRLMKARVRVDAFPLPITETVVVQQEEKI